MIFFFRLKAITSSLLQGVRFFQFTNSISFARKGADFETKLIRVTLTSKKRKQFQIKGQEATAGGGGRSSQQEEMLSSGSSYTCRLLLPPAPSIPIVGESNAFALE
jgi:hypothetical protein